MQQPQNRQSRKPKYAHNKTQDGASYLKAEAVALMKRLAVHFLNVDLLDLVHVREVAGVETFVCL